MSGDKTQEGCELCGDWPVHLHPKCHPTAPLRLEMGEAGTLVAYCYVPACNREVARFRLAQPEGQQVGWFNPASQRFCYTDEKEANPEYFRRYTVPVVTSDSASESRADGPEGGRSC